MTYELVFHPSAMSERNKLAKPIREQFKKKLGKRLENPRVESAHVSGGSHLFKIKLRAAGFRLVYQVQDQTITVLVLSVGKRECNAAYNAALVRL
ncbi:mRNA interferase toxin RelE [Candidatus Nitrotoga sp. HW29]|uniref:type II toxin-antitoxin system RelE family toxin n=1 Tax=Candidatus Nitrotoga sp. HW29 TaxID=2886963 RepID=UPI000E3A2625|nr:type II toxin-antitoxin system RelE/ParE family toxin [Candidatus Nitrotoga sp. HW29]RFC31720.1 MAG: mRNA interferase RelE/StbE [Candidatus Nitrotoga sp. SPKER]CAH1904647.1 mRNA interferase toxin RelE [Candidatus Nitrotoga sp. HW29]